MVVGMSAISFRTRCRTTAMRRTSIEKFVVHDRPITYYYFAAKQLDDGINFLTFNPIKIDSKRVRPFLLSVFSVPRSRIQSERKIDGSQEKICTHQPWMGNFFSFCAAHRELIASIIMDERTENKLKLLLRVCDGDDDDYDENVDATKKYNPQHGCSLQIHVKWFLRK